MQQTRVVIPGSAGIGRLRIAKGEDLDGKKMDLWGFLAEAPVKEGLIWSYDWGGTPQRPKIIGDLGRAMESAKQSQTVLVDGRYGTGKTSFLKMLARALCGPSDAERPGQCGPHGTCVHEPHETARSERAESDQASRGGLFRELWLDMPVITSNLHREEDEAIRQALARPREAVETT